MCENHTCFGLLMPFYESITSQKDAAYMVIHTRLIKTDQDQNLQLQLKWAYPSDLCEKLNVLEESPGH